ncbi:MAG: cryptochrome/photolyase family protein [Paracoccaceae bacterium]
MVRPRLVLVLGDQLSPGLSALAAADKSRDVVVMAEVAGETDVVPHHPRKIALVLSAMRKFARALREAGWHVAYTTLDDPDNSGSIPAELLRRASEVGAAEVLVTTPGDWRLIEALATLPLSVHQFEDTRFVCSAAAFRLWAEERKSLRMEWFYRDMRRRTGLLMQGDAPEGGRWNYDSDNRKPPQRELGDGPPPAFEPDETVAAVLDLVEARFPDNFGRLRPFDLATDRAQALRVLDHFITRSLPRFGDYQDAMLIGEPYLYHALISPYLNLGLLSPIEVCRAAEAAYHAGEAPLNAVEGFIRQIIGWREFVRGIYLLAGPDYVRRNALGHQRPLPALFWGGPTRMRCLSEVVGQTRDLGYAHHIQRLMITGNFALLAGVDPFAVHEWYLSVYVDAFEWVEAPNTLGMSQFADGGMVASKPYVSSGAYIARMSDYCRGCAYDVSAKQGEGACPFNLLYWHFLDRHRRHFAANPRMGPIYRGWDARPADQRARILAEGDALLAQLDRGDTV